MTARAKRAERVPAIVLPAGLGDETETIIERIVPGGFGLGFGGGRTLFVARAAPGDRLRVRIDREHGRVAHASIVEILEPGPDRVDEAYPLLSRCGADFQHLRYEAQLEAKRGMIADSLRRIGGIALPEPLPVTTSPLEWGYRARAAWRHDPVQPALGYHEAGTHRVVDLPQDPFVVPALAARFEELRERLMAGRLPEWATELRAAAGDDGVSLAPPLDLPQPVPVHATVAGERYEYDADCFFQANPAVLEPLIAEALRFAPEPAAPAAASRLAIDFYCGVGLFTVPLARRFAQVIGVEAQPRAAEFAVRNVAAAGLSNAQIRIASVERWLDGAHRSHGRAPFVLLDPPRAGLPAHGLRVLPRLRAARIAYISCDPATLARDLKGLLASGYALVAMAAFDMFPQTHHVEIVAHLEWTGTEDGKTASRKSKVESRKSKARSVGAMPASASPALPRPATRRTANSQQPTANSQQPIARSRPWIVPFGQTAAEMPALSPVGLGEFDQGVQERVDPGVFLVKVEAAKLVQHALIGREIIAGPRQPLQLMQTRIVGGQFEDIRRQCVQRRGGPQIALVTVVLLGLAAPPVGRGPAERRHRLLERRGFALHASARFRGAHPDRGESARYRRYWHRAA